MSYRSMMASLIILKSPLFFFFTLNPLLICWFPYVGIFPNLLFHIIPFHSLPVALFIFLSPFFSRPKASLSVIVLRVSLVFPQKSYGLRIWMPGKDWSLLGSPCCSFGPFYPEGHKHRGTDHK